METAAVPEATEFLMVISSNREDLKNGLDMISVQSIANNICFVLYLVFYIGFMLVLDIVAESWWHVLLAIAVMSPIHICGLYLICYLRDGLGRVHAMRRPKSDDDLGCKLVASANV
ncbi:hypothetical protein D1007_07528 [Hordeum vulgare]|nr:hypothetical protein D1007_07528 [Hordeum vulgare]KAI4987132.1 hypothetical protein ZWY2020_019932 [Hordeum vulgare]